MMEFVEGKKGLIDEALLKAYGAIEIYSKKDTYLFRQAAVVKYYFQLVEGEVNIHTISESGDVFTHSRILHTDNKIFGCAAIFYAQVYPASAILSKNSKVLKISVENFEKLIAENNQVAKLIIEKLSERLLFKAKRLESIAMQEPAQRILALLRQITKGSKESKKINLTRQEIANLTALRVETVIRTIKKLEKEKKLEIKNRKVYFPFGQN